MVFVDTNVLVNLMRAETQQQTEALVNAASKPLVISDAVLAELCGLLQYNNRFLLPRGHIVDFLQLLLGRKEFLFGGKGSEAIKLFAKHPKLDMVDCLVACYGGGQARSVVTSDTNLKRILN